MALQYALKSGIVVLQTFFFFFNYLGSLVLNIKLGYSVTSIIDILVETALNL